MVLKRGKLCKSEGIKLINGQTIKEVDAEGYKYLGILELDKFRDGPLENLWGGGGRSTKKKFAQWKIE